MSDAEKKILAHFYISEHGNEPVRDWLKTELTREQRTAVGEDIKAVEYGWPMGMPTVRKLDASLWEVRTTFRDGIARVFFTVDGNKMVLLHGVKKKARKARPQDLDTAMKRLAMYRAGERQ